MVKSGSGGSRSGWVPAGAGSSIVRPLMPLLVGMVLTGAVSGCARDTTKHPETRPRAGIVTVDLSGIGVESGRFHSYRSGSGRKVDFFVYREDSGMPHAVLDACRTCYRWKKGYVLDGKQVVCITCGLRFRLDSLAQGTGSCVPIALKTEQRGDSLLIPVTELEAGVGFF